MTDTNAPTPKSERATAIDQLMRDLAAREAELAQWKDRALVAEKQYNDAAECAERAEAARDAAMKAIDRIKRALMPDPHDERHISIDWLRKEIHATIDQSRRVALLNLRDKAGR